MYHSINKENKGGLEIENVENENDNEYNNENVEDVLFYVFYFFTIGMVILYSSVASEYIYGLALDNRIYIDISLTVVSILFCYKVIRELTRAEATQTTLTHFGVVIHPVVIIPILGFSSIIYNICTDLSSPSKQAYLILVCIEMLLWIFMISLLRMIRINQIYQENEQFRRSMLAMASITFVWSIATFLDENIHLSHEDTNVVSLDPFVVIFNITSFLDFKKYYNGHDPDYNFISYEEIEDDNISMCCLGVKVLTPKHCVYIMNNSKITFFRIDNVFYTSFILFFMVGVVIVVCTTSYVDPFVGLIIISGLKLIVVICLIFPRTRQEKRDREIYHTEYMDVSLACNIIVSGLTILVTHDDKDIDNESLILQKIGLFLSIIIHSVEYVLMRYWNNYVNDTYLTKCRLAMFGMLSSAHFVQLIWIVVMVNVDDGIIYAFRPDLIGHVMILLVSLAYKWHLIAIQNIFKIVTLDEPIEM